MKRRLFSGMMLVVAASLLAGCIYTNWHDHHGGGNAYGHSKGSRGGGGGRR